MIFGGILAMYLRSVDIKGFMEDLIMMELFNFFIISFVDRMHIKCLMDVEFISLRICFMGNLLLNF